MTPQTKKITLITVAAAIIFSFSSFSASTSNETLTSAGNEEIELFQKSTSELYTSIDFNKVRKPDFDLFSRSVIGFYQLKKLGRVNGKDILTIIDFRKSSKEKRLWSIDLKNRKVLFHSLVAHGRNTGELYAKTFSNRKHSNQSSLGFYVTGNTYTGKHGTSLILHGMEQGFNSNAEQRAVVMHGADYVNENFIKMAGRLGRSQGCPAVPMGLHEEMIPQLKEGTVLFIYYPDKEYLSKTAFNNATEAAKYFNELNGQLSALN